MDLIFPTGASFSHAGWEPVSNTVAARSIFSGAVNTTERAGPRWRISISKQNSSDRNTTSYAERSLLKAIRSALNGQANRIWVRDPGYVQRGTFPTGELLANNTFNGTTGWVSSNANLVLSASDRVLRGTRAGVAADYTIQAAVATTVNGATYVARLLTLAGKGALDYRLQLGTSAAGTQLAADSGDVTAAGMRTLVGTATGTSTHFSILDGIGSRSVGDYMEFAYASLSRCMLVAGGSQTGRSLNVDQLPASTDGLLLPGDRVQIGNTLCMVTAPLNSNSSGAGYLQLHRAPRAVPADNAPVIVHNPMGRFVMTESGGWDDRPGQFSDFEMTLEEALDS
jgi:hypothetical protein